jgi:hypothetical protein
VGAGYSGGGVLLCHQGCTALIRCKFNAWVNAAVDLLQRSCGMVKASSDRSCDLIRAKI